MQPQYIFENGAMKTNPDWEKSNHHHSSTKKLNEALAFVSSTEEIMKATRVQTDAQSSQMTVVETTINSMQVFQTPAYLNSFNDEGHSLNLDGDSMLNDLGKVFAKYEFQSACLTS